MTNSHPPADRDAAFEEARATVEAFVSSLENREKGKGDKLQVPYGACRILFAGYDASAARVAELEAEVNTLRGAVSWIEEPFVSAATPKSQLWQRIQFVQADIARFDARAARASTPGEGEKT